MLTLVVAEGVALVLLALLVAGVLRSHAEILRMLHGLGLDLDSAGAPQGNHVSVEGPASGAPSASDIVGQSPGGDIVRIAVRDVDHDTLLAFLSSGCGTCSAFWEEIATAEARLLPARLRLIVVTRGPEDESESAVANLTPSSVTTVMSSEAWRDYDVPGAPYFVHVDASGRLVGGGTGLSWGQVTDLLGRAVSDAGLAARRVAKARSDAAREQRADEDLLRAGITPAHHSLWPSGRDGDG